MPSTPQAFCVEVFLPSRRMSFCQRSLQFNPNSELRFVTAFQELQQRCLCLVAPNVPESLLCSVPKNALKFHRGMRECAHLCCILLLAMASLRS